MTEERGDTLVEILMALALLGIVVAAIAGSLIGSAAASTTAKDTAALDAVLRGFAASMQAEVGTSATFRDCATADTGGSPYQVVSVPNPAQGPSGTLVTVFITGLNPGGPVSVEDTTPGAIPPARSTFPVDGQGDATLTFRVRGPIGSHVLQFTNGQTTLSQSQNFTVTSSGAASADLAGFGLQVTDLQWWTGPAGDSWTEAVDPPTGGCPSNGLQLVTILGWSPGGVHDWLTFTIYSRDGVAPSLPASPIVVPAGGSAIIRAGGSPTPTFAFAPCGGTGPGITAADNLDGTATISTQRSPDGTPPGTYKLCVTATNGVSPAASATLTLVVPAAGQTAGSDSASTETTDHVSG
ncbi:MAG: type II secretion system protein [Acidobacteriota bacterium]|nr:type II secretion system protein [Acidobacteriota bacterium]